MPGVHKTHAIFLPGSFIMWTVSLEKLKQWLNSLGRLSKLDGNEVLACGIGLILHSYLKKVMHHRRAWKFSSWIPGLAYASSHPPLLSANLASWASCWWRLLQISRALLKVTMGSVQQTCTISLFIHSKCWHFCLRSQDSQEFLDSCSCYVTITMKEQLGASGVAHPHSPV